MRGRSCAEADRGASSLLEGGRWRAGVLTRMLLASIREGLPSSHTL